MVYIQVGLILVSTLIYRIASGNINELFFIDPTTGEIKVNGELDYETKPNVVSTEIL